MFVFDVTRLDKGGEKSVFVLVVIRASSALMIGKLIKPTRCERELCTNDSIRGSNVTLMTLVDVFGTYKWANSAYYTQLLYITTEYVAAIEKYIISNVNGDR